jgi:hypothetical protein
MSRPSADQLREALANKNLFQAARLATAWIEAATLEEVRTFVKDPKRFPRVYFVGLDGDFQKAFADALVERWLTLAPEDIALIEKHDVMFKVFTSAAARMKPELVLAQLYPEGKGSYFRNVVPLAFEALARRDIAAARHILASVPNELDRKTFEFSVLKGLADADVFSAISLLPSRNAENPDPKHAAVAQAIVEAAERMGPGALRNAFAASDGKLDGYAHLPRLLLRYPDLAADLADGGAAASRSFWLSDNLLHDADLTPAETRDRLLADYEKLPAAGRDELCAALACSWARSDPRAAAQWAVEHAQPNDAASSANSAAKHVFLRWVNSDPETAARWWQSLPESAMRDVIGTEASTRYAEHGDFETALKMFRPTAEKVPPNAAAHFALLYAEHDPSAAAAWLAALPSGSTDDRAVGIVTSRYYNADPVAAAQWAESLPAGPYRDQALKHLVKKAGQVDPAGATAWVDQIEDQKLREEASVSIAFAWRFRDPDAMREWVRNQPALGDGWRAMFLRP